MWKLHYIFLHTVLCKIVINASRSENLSNWRKIFLERTSTGQYTFVFTCDSLEEKRISKIHANAVSMYVVKLKEMFVAYNIRVFVNSVCRVFPVLPSRLTAAPQPARTDANCTGV